MNDFSLEVVLPKEIYLEISIAILVFQIDAMKSATKPLLEHSHTELNFFTPLLWTLLKCLDHGKSTTKAFAEVHPRTILIHWEANYNTFFVLVTGLA